MINEVFMLSDIFKLDKKRLNKTGIYCIFNVKNDKYYIGQTNSLKKYGGLFQRLKTHITSLRGGYHDNIFFQRSFNKYGENCFRFQILEICSEKDLSDREIYWGEFYNSLSPNGYNFMLGEEDALFSSCMKQKMSKSRPDISGYNNPKCKWAKIDDFGGVNKIINLKNSGLSRGEIADMIGVSKHSFDNYLYYQGLSWQKIGKYNTLDEKIDYLGGINKIIDLKESGKTRKDISLFFNISTKTLDSFLEKNGVKWSNIGKYGDNTSFYRIDTMGGIKKIVKLKESGKKKKDASLFFNISTNTLDSFLEKNGVKWSNLGKYNTLDEKIDYLGGIKKIIELKKSGKTKKDVSSFFNISTKTLDSFLEKNGVKWLNIGKYGNNTSFYRIDTMGGIKKIIEIKELGKSEKEVCLFFNISYSTLNTFLNEYNLKWSDLGKYGNHTSFYYMDTVGGMKKINLLIKKGYTRKKISDIMKIDQETLREYIKFHMGL